MRGIYIIIIIGVFITLFTIGQASAYVNLTADVGETWIRWEWNALQNNTVNVYVDSVLKRTNETREFYYLQGVEPSEKHNIKLYNSSNTSELLAQSTITTLYPVLIIYLLLAIVIIIGFVMLFAKDPIKIILLGVTTVSLALYTASLCNGYGGIYYLPLIITVLVGAYLAMIMWDFIRKEAAWY